MCFLTITWAIIKHTELPSHVYSLTLTCTIIVTITWAIITGKHQIKIKCTLLHKYVPSLYKISYF